MARARNRSGADKGVQMSEYRKQQLAEREKERNKVLSDAAQRRMDAIDKATINEQAALEARRRQVETDLRHIEPEQLSEHAKTALGIDDVSLEELQRRKQGMILASQAETDEQKAIAMDQNPEIPAVPLTQITPAPPANPNEVAEVGIAHPTEEEKKAEAEAKAEKEAAEKKAAEAEAKAKTVKEEDEKPKPRPPVELGPSTTELRRGPAVSSNFSKPKGK